MRIEATQLKMMAERRPEAVPNPGSVQEAVRQGQTNIDLPERQEAPDKEELEGAVQKMNEAAEVFNSALKFQVAEDRSIVIQVIDTNSGEIVKEIPPGKLMDAVHRVEQTIGLLVDHRL